MNDKTHFTPTEACTLIAHEAVSMLDTVQTEMPECMNDFRTALEALHTVHGLGQDGEALLAWVDAEIASAEQFVADGTNLPNLIDLCQLNTEPDIAVQMDLVWMLFDTAAREECGTEQRRALLNTARTVTEMCSMDDLLLATLRPNTAKLADELGAELADIHTVLHTGKEPAMAAPEQDNDPAPPTGLTR